MTAAGIIASLILAAVPVASAQNCSGTSTGMKPLNGPFFGVYKNSPGGLYLNGSNKRPAAHEAAGLTQAAQVRPRDSAGNIDEQNGSIVLLSIGMSNTTQEFSAFQTLAATDPDRNTAVMPVDGAQGGWSADRIVADPDTYWSGVEQHLQAAQVSGRQVQAAWVKLADPNPTLPFPDDAKKLQSEIQKVIGMAKARYPNLRLAYLSSRIYAGYASSPLNPEPYAYQSGFSVKWLIEAQINGDPALDVKSGKMPWLSWGPYLWADGTARRFDGLVWNCSDLGPDGTHPSDAGRRKVARMLLDFFKADSTARPWFVAKAVQSPGTPSPALAVNAAGFFPNLAPGGVATMFGTGLSGTVASAAGLPLPYGLGGATVDVGGEPAPIYFVSPTQINFVVPPAPNGNTVTITREGSASAAITAQIALNTEGLFTTGDAASAAALHPDGSLITAQNPARPGEIIALFGTGKGIRNPAILIAEFLPLVQIGGLPAQVQFFGPAPVYPGLDQLNVTVPANAPAGSAIPVAVRVGSFTANTVTIAIAPGG